MFILAAIKVIVGCGILAYIGAEFYTGWKQADNTDMEL